MDEPKLADYGLSSSFYGNYLQKVTSLNNSKNSLDQQINRYAPAWLSFLQVVLGIAIFIISLIWIIRLTDISGWFGWLILLPFAFAGYFADDDRNVLANIFSLGKYNKAKKARAKIDKRLGIIEEQASEKLSPFESATKEYYEKQLSQIYTTRLYRKHSGNEQFQEALRGLLVDH